MNQTVSKIRADLWVERIPGHVNKDGTNFGFLGNSRVLSPSNAYPYYTAAVGKYRWHTVEPFCHRCRVRGRNHPRELSPFHWSGRACGRGFASHRHPDQRRRHDPQACQAGERRCRSATPQAQASETSKATLEPDRRRERVDRSPARLHATPPLLTSACSTPRLFTRRYFSVPCRTDADTAIAARPPYLWK